MTHSDAKRHRRHPQGQLPSPATLHKRGQGAPGKEASAFRKVSPAGLRGSCVQRGATLSVAFLALHCARARCRCGVSDMSRRRRLADIGDHTRCMGGDVC